MRKAKVLLAALLVSILCTACSTGTPAVVDTAAPSPAVSPAASLAPAPSQAASATPSPSASAEAQASATPGRKYMFDLTIPAPSLKKNMLEQKPENKIYVILPKSYYDSDRRYPVVYFLHGFGQDYARFVLQYGAMVAFADYIRVGVNGGNSLGGTFFANSPVTGNWEDMVVKDAVGYVDQHYRTIAAVPSRGLFGLSMGGFGVINIGMKHPDVFSAVCAVSPGLFDPNGLKKGMGDWDDVFKASYGAVFSPDLKAGPPYARIPQFDSSKADNAVIANWEKGFGDLENKIKAYLALPGKLAGLHIIYGISDEYKWIPEGCAYFSKLLNQYRIAHDLVSCNSYHVISASVMGDDVQAFFSKTLKNQ